MPKAAIACTVFSILASASFLAFSPRDHVEATCKGCHATYVTAEEIRAFLDRDVLDQQVRSADAGALNVHIALVHRGPLAEPGAVAEHSLVTEVYYILSGGGSHRTGPDLIGSQPRPADNFNVRMLTGPGHNAADIRNAETQELAAGDVLIIPAGTGHHFTRIDDHITYLMVRIDPDRVVPVMTAEDARDYLAGTGPWVR